MIMQEWSKFDDAVQHVDVVLFDRFSNHCLANFIEPLRAANGFLSKSAYQWRFVTLDGTPVQGSSGLLVAPHDRLAEAPVDMLVLMPSYGIRDLVRAETLRSI